MAPGAVAPIPETLIAERWRRLGSTRADGSTYHGCRLKPSLWRLVAAALARRPDLLSLPVEEVAALLPTIRDEARASGQHLGTISPRVLLTLLRFLARGDRIARILEAHRQRPRDGVTDLLLYRQRNGRAIDFHFVEVKKATERVYADQVEEIEMLRGLGLKAGIVRLEAPKSKAVTASPRTAGRSRTATQAREAAAPALLANTADADDDELTPEESESIDQAVDEEMERWARSLIVVVDGEVRKLTEEEVQLAVQRPPAVERPVSPPPARKRRIRSRA